MPTKKSPIKKTSPRRKLIKSRSFNKLHLGLIVGVLAALGALVVVVTNASGVPCTGSCVAIMSSAGAGNTGYWVVGGDGGVFGYGGAQYYGSRGGQALNRPMVGGAATPSGHGYWLVGGDGGIFPYGDAPGVGSVPGVGVNVSNIVGMARTPNGQGYWVVGSNGAVYAFGNAPYKGGVNGTPLNGPIVGIAGTPSGQGYWMLGSDGGIFAFGDASAIKSFAGVPHNYPFTAIASMPTGQGYWAVGSDGGVFTAGTAGFYGSAGGQGSRGIRSIAPTPSGQGYWLVGSDGAVYPYGNAGQAPPVQPTATPRPTTQPPGTTPKPATPRPTSQPPGTGGNNGGGSTGGGSTGGGNNGGGGVSPVAVAPATPTDFTAVTNQGSSTVSLSWNGAAASYSLERSTDNATWNEIAKQPETSYDDKDTTFDVHYFYRVKGVNIDLSSDYATTDVTTQKFANNTAGGTTLKSDDGNVSVVIPDGAMGGDAACSIISGSDHTSSLKFDKKSGIAAGPYSLVCQAPDGTAITSFGKPLAATIVLTATQAKGYKKFAVTGHGSDSSATWQPLKAQVDKSGRNYSFALTAPLDFAVLGTHGAAIPWGAIFVILFLLGIGGAIYYFILRRGQSAATRSSSTRKYYEY